MRVGAAIFLWVVLLRSPEACAAEAEPQDGREVRDLARALATRGLGLIEAGKPAEAVEVLTRANEIYRAPTIMAELARALERTDRLLEARAILEQVVAYELTSESPVEFEQAKRRSAEALKAVNQEIPVVIVTLRGFRDPIELTVDEGRVESLRVAVDPGIHQLRAVGADGARAVAEVTVARRDQVTVTLAAPVWKPIDDEPSGWFVAAMTFFVAGSASAVVGATTGGLAIERTDRYQELCPLSPCDPAAREPFEAADALATASTASFSLAGGLIALGLTFAIVDLTIPSEGTTVAFGPGFLRLGL